MKLNLQKPLVIFDLETTGLDLVKDRIIQLSYIKVYPDGREVRGNELVNPEKFIDPLITQLTGITDKMVIDADTIDKVLPRFLSFRGLPLITHAVFLRHGHAVRSDIPEGSRSGYPPV